MQKQERKKKVLIPLGLVGSRTRWLVSVTATTASTIPESHTFVKLWVVLLYELHL